MGERGSRENVTLKKMMRKIFKNLFLFFLHNILFDRSTICDILKLTFNGKIVRKKQSYRK